MLVGCVGCSTSRLPQRQDTACGELDMGAMFLPVPSTAKLVDPDYFTWGASMVHSIPNHNYLI